jgi:WD40 repeat protein
MLRCPINQVAQDKELLEIARDCSHFMTKFFEPINVSATHIYHSALELSPLSSIVRRLYYHQRHTPYPRVVVGTPDSWDQSLALPYVGSIWILHWSPCGQFVAVQTEKAVEIRDPLSFELLSTLQPTEPTSQLMGALAYSPDGHSLASLSNTSLIIWDIQTGGVAKEIPCDKTSGGSVVWSLMEDSWHHRSGWGPG